jgi:hypothetical protein
MENEPPRSAEWALGKTAATSRSRMRPDVPFLWRLGLVVLAWYLAFSLTVHSFAIWRAPELPGMWHASLPALLLFFPTGLVSLPVYCLGIHNGPEVLLNSLWALAGVLYVAMVGVLLLTPRGKVFWMVYVALLILLALNVQGCRMDIQQTIEQLQHK